MGFQGYIDRDYQATRMSADEQKRWEREHSCHRQGCDAAAADTLKCDFCGDYFCGDHSIDYDGTGACFLCARRDMDINDAADQLLAADELLKLVEQARRGCMMSPQNERDGHRARHVCESRPISE